MSNKEVLSEGELDALMDSVSNGDIAEEDTSGADGEYRTFDFQSRDQSLLAQMPALDTIEEQHAAGLEQGIRDLFKIPAQVQAGEVTLSKLKDALVAIPDPSAINTLRTAPLNGNSFLVVPGELLSFCVDQYFGGYSGGQRQRHPGNQLTPTEVRINEVLTKRFLDTLQAAWAEIISLDGQLVGTETNPEYLRTGPPDQPVLTFPFQLKVLEWESRLDWVVPYAMLEPLRPKLGPSSGRVQETQGSADWQSHIYAELPAVKLELSALFASGEVSIDKIIGLKKGAIVPLAEPNEITVYIEGQPYFTAEHGALNGKKSIKIIEVLAVSGNTINGRE